MCGITHSLRIDFYQIIFSFLNLKIHHAAAMRRKLICNLFSKFKKFFFFFIFTKSSFHTNNHNICIHGEQQNNTKKKC